MIINRYDVRAHFFSGYEQIKFKFLGGYSISNIIYLIIYIKTTLDSLKI